MRRVLAILLIVLLPAGGASGKSSYGDYARAVRALEEWRYGDARKLVTALQKESPSAPETKFLAAQVAFYEGDYAGARKALEALTDSSIKSVRDDFLPLVAATEETTRGFEKHVTSGGHFVIHYPPGKEELLIDIADEALEAAYAAITADFGWTASEPIRVEILGRVSDLARVSTLTEKEIETSGTIALCKYNKLMIVTPRATLLGYPWLDTLAHELAHFVITKATRDRVPIWLHEGLAKFEETRWRAAAGAPGMGRVAEHLLATALKKGRLISFDEMHPSMAKLPSQEAAGTAFAEVYSIVAWLHGQVGYQGIREVLAKILDGKSERRAIGEVMDDSWEDVERRWKKHLKASGLKADTTLGKGAARRLKLKKSEADEENVGAEEIADKEARKYARLGGLLRARARYAAAVLEYEKALAIVGPGDPFVAGKLARTYLELGNAERAIEVATPLAARDELDAGAQATLGTAYLRTGDHAKAATHLILAVRVSPFDPEVRCGLAEVYTATRDTIRAEREKGACRALRK